MTTENIKLEVLRAMNARKNVLRGRAVETLKASSWGLREAEEAADIVLDVVFDHAGATSSELLAACKNLLSHFESGGLRDYAGLPLSNSHEADMARAAIAKAEGSEG